MARSIGREVEKTQSRVVPRRRRREIAATMSNLLLWLAIPLLLLPVVARRDRLGAAAGQLIISGLGLGALQQGAATLDPRDLRDIASQSPHAAWFIGITVGVTITGACLFPDFRNGRKGLVAGPLLFGLLLSISANAVVAVLIGALIGLVPTTLGQLGAWARSSSGAVPSEDADRPGARRRFAGAGLFAARRRSADARSGRSASLLFGALTVASALFGPVAVTAAAFCGLVWCEWSRLPKTRAINRLPILPTAATILLAAWLWLALTIAGSPWISLGRFATDAPVSVAAGALLAMLGTGWGIAIAAPWPFDRLTDVTVQLPVLGVVLYLAAHATPDGMAHWQPLLTMIMVPVAVAAAALGRWDGAAAALLLMGATRPGAGGFAAALLLAITPAGRRLTRSERLSSGVVGGAVALLVAVVLRDQVVLGVALALGVAVVAIRRDRVVAPA